MLRKQRFGVACPSNQPTLGGPTRPFGFAVWLIRRLLRAVGLGSKLYHACGAYASWLPQQLELSA